MTETKKSFNDGVQNRELNQYWYSEKTIKVFTDEITMYGIPHGQGKVAFLSTPSIYFSFPKETRQKYNFTLFEFDKKFGEQIKEEEEGSEKNFVFYDFNHPEKIPADIRNTFDYIVVDPPFITEEVWSKYISAVLLLGKRTAAQEGVEAGSSAQNAFRCLFTTVVENHSMLENHMDMALFVPDFRPTVLELVYQYSCFVNYPHISGGGINSGVAQINDEIPAEDPKLRSGRQMANDLRESEVEFTAQMRNRKRDGEKPLPAIQHKQEQQQQQASSGNNNVDTNDESSSAACCGSSSKNKKKNNQEEEVNPLLNKPVSEMRWGHVPEGWTEYADGGDNNNNNATTLSPTEISPEAYGKIYIAALSKRELLDEWKKAVDVSFKVLDAMVSVFDDTDDASASAATTTENQASSSTATTATSEAAENLKKHCVSVQNNILNKFAEMLKTDQEILETARKENSSEVSKLSLDYRKDLSLMEGMQTFLGKLYDTKMHTKSGAKDFAIDATRNYKSPAFNRQKDLLAVIKAEKKKYQVANKK